MATGCSGTASSSCNQLPLRDAACDDHLARYHDDKGPASMALNVAGSLPEELDKLGKVCRLQRPRRNAVPEGARVCVGQGRSICGSCSCSTICNGQALGPGSSPPERLARAKLSLTGWQTQSLRAIHALQRIEASANMPNHILTHSRPCYTLQHSVKLRGLLRGRALSWCLCPPKTSC